jgi:hypothetical protein
MVGTVSRSVAEIADVCGCAAVKNVVSRRTNEQNYSVSGKADNKQSWLAFCRWNDEPIHIPKKREACSIIRETDQPYTLDTRYQMQTNLNCITLHANWPRYTTSNPGAYKPPAIPGANFRSDTGFSKCYDLVYTVVWNWSLLTRDSMGNVVSKTCSLAIELNQPMSFSSFTYVHNSF